MAHIFRQCCKAPGSRDDAHRNVVRELGMIDSYQLAMHTLDHYRGTLVACRYYPPASLVRPEAEAPHGLRDRFYNAVANVALAQPLLQLGIIDENTKTPKFVRLERLDLDRHLEWRSIESSQLETERLEVLQSQLDARFEHLSTQPGWRIVVLYTPESMEVIYIWNHPHHDGMSAKTFHRHLLRNLNDPKLEPRKGSGGWSLELPRSSDIPPPPEALSPFPTTVPWLLKSIWESVKPYSIFPLTDEHARWAPIEVTPFATGFRTFAVDVGTVAKVIVACHDHNTTLTGLLHALVLVSLSSRLPSMKGFASRTPYDMRQVLPSHVPEYPWLDLKETMYNYVSVLDHQFDADLVATIRDKLPAVGDGKEAGVTPDLLEAIWPVAARVRREIKAKLDMGGKNDLFSMMKFVSDWRDQQHTEVTRPRYLSWLVTNLGVLDGGVDGEPHGQPSPAAWSIRRAELVLSTEVQSAAVNVSVMTVKGGQMAVTCSWQDCVVDADLGTHLAGDLERWLNEIVPTTNPVIG